MSEALADGWYKITQGNNVFIRHFVDGYTETGYHADEFARFDSVFEPVIVMTPDEHAAAQARIQQLERELAECNKSLAGHVWAYNVPDEDGEYDMGVENEPLYIFGNTEPEVCTHVEWQNESVMLDLGMTVCRWQEGE